MKSKEIIFALLIMISGHAYASDYMLYQGNELISTSVLAQAFAEAGLQPDEISNSHYEVIKDLYREIGIDFIGLVEEEREPQSFIINENPHWVVSERLTPFVATSIRSFIDLKTTAMMGYLSMHRLCARVHMNGPESFILEEVSANQKDLLDPEQMVCPD